LLQPVEAALDESPIIVHPSVKVTKRLGAQRVETSLSVGADADEPAVVENPKMARDSGLAHGQGRD
jgi:hypothetical protein